VREKKIERDKTEKICGVQAELHIALAAHEAVVHNTYLKNVTKKVIKKKIYA